MRLEAQACSRCYSYLSMFIKRFLSLAILFLVSACNRDRDIELPTAITDRISRISMFEATVWSTNYGTGITGYGVCYSTLPDPSLNDFKTFHSSSLDPSRALGSHISVIDELSPNTLYYVRAYAHNSSGTAYGEVKTFRTLVETPRVITSPISNISTNSAISGGEINYGSDFTIITRGVCWNKIGDPTIAENKTMDGSGEGSFISSLNGLIENVTYHVRAYATNNVDTYYGPNILFTTSRMPSIVNPDTIFDVEGNKYLILDIGEQTWMAENLKTTKYNDGTDISSNIGADNSSGAYAWYDNDQSTYKELYGALYNFNAVRTGKLCPTGWHVPKDSEWGELIVYLGGELYAGGRLKETGTNHWKSPNTAATNEVGFTALPGGVGFSGFSDIGELGMWWTKNAVVGYPEFPNHAVHINIRYFDGNAYQYPENESHGLSVRCIKD